MVIIHNERHAESSFTDVGSESSEVCQWKFFGKGAKRAEVCCTSIVYATDKKQTKVTGNRISIYLCSRLRLIVIHPLSLI